MTTTELLTRLRKLNVTLSFEDGQLIFNGPKGALTAKLRAELSERKAEILKFFHNAAATRAAPTESNLRRVSRDKDLALSFAQQRLWFLDQLEPGSAVYNVPGVFRIKGPLDVAVLTQCLEEIVRRHEALRTTFSIVEGGPFQVIAPLQSLSPAAVDISHLSESKREAEALRLAAEEANKPFDLRQGPLVRATLIRLGENDHVLLLTLHHIVSDGWSMGVLYRELSALYQAFANGEPSPLADLPIQYADFAAWQRDCLRGEVLESQLSYWKKQLEGAPAVLNLSTDRPRPAVQSFRGARHSVEISAELTEGLKTLSRKEGATLYMTLLAAFQTLLHRYTGQDDIVVGSPIANRNRIEIEGLIGFFVNTLVLRTDYSGNPTFRELLHRVRETALEAYAHQDLPFEKLVEELRPDRDLSRSPVFQAMFVLQNAPAGELNCKGLNVSPMRMAGETTKFDLTLSVHEGGPGLRAALQYSTDLFEKTTITRFLGHFQILLEGIVANPEQRISDLPILTEAEKHQVLVEWNETKSDYPKDTCLHQLFEEQVKRTPESIAVIFEDRQLTYRELNRCANYVARSLQKLGVGPDVLVGLCVERSIELVIGILGILKTGGAYVALDAEYPRERLAFMFQDARPLALVTQERFADTLPANGITIVSLDIDWAQIGAENDSNLVSSVTDKNVAYVIYTSGSTGRPKGVMVDHRAISNHMRWIFETFPLEPRDRVAQKTPISFDASVWEFWAPLLSGAQLVLARPGGHRDAPYLVNFIREKQISILQVGPTFLQLLLEENMSDCTSLRHVFCGGEALSVELQARFRTQLSAELHNLYGPTEASIDATYFTCTGHTGLTSVPIGRPISNMQAYVLDRHFHPVPVGVPAELYLSGIGLSRGYLSQPELTAEKFVPNPFREEAGERCYRTGDLVRYLADGNIEFLGRIDNQIKIRNFRIEPGEIETLLCRHAQVIECVISAHGDANGEKRLVAYIVASTAHDLNSGKLRDFLRGKLPEYMIPNAFVFLESLPLTVSGKVDRRALPAPDGSRPELTEAYAAPRNQTEELLAKIWAEVLKLEQVGIHDNFFDLGGHSLLAAQVVSRIRRFFQFEVPLRCLFENPTVATFAANMEIVSDVKNGGPIIPIQHVFQKENIPLSFAQQRLWFLDQLELGNPAFNLNGSFRLTGLLNQEALEQSLNEIVRRHDSLRTTFNIFDENPVQVIAPSQTIKIQTVDLQNLPTEVRETQARKLAFEDSKCVFDLKKGPLFRAQLIRLSPRDHVLGIRMHHIVSDGWSLGVLYRELSALYQAYSSGRPSPLAELPIQYADYSVWQKDWFKGERLETELLYWKNQLRGVPPILELPTDHPRPAVQTYRGGRAACMISDELHVRLKSLGGEEGVTLFMVLLAAFQVQLYRYTGQDDVVVGSPLAGRNSSETDGLIGFFLNNVVLRTRLSGNPTFRELLSQVREVALGAYGHQDLPFEKLLEELHPERELSRTPLFQVYLNMLSMDDSKLKLEGLTIEALGTSEPESKFDLTLYVKEDRRALRFNLVYNADLFEQSRIDEVLRQLEHLLSQVVDNPGQNIDSYSLVTPYSKKLLPNPSEKLDDDWKGAVHEHFTDHAKSNPLQLAVIDCWDQWTYHELNYRSNQFAHYLLTRGIRSGDLIAVYGHRSASLVCAVLGILKAGAAFLILDPAYPAVRIIKCLEEAKPTGWIDIEAGGPLSSELKAYVDTLSFGCRLALPRTSGSIGNRLNEYSVDEPGVPTRADDVAYVSFTSGSTGKPKGVLGKHGSLSHFLPWQENTFGLTAVDRFTMLSGLSHDPLQRDMFTPLWVGATICIPDPDFMGTAKLALWMNEQRVTFAHLTPAMLRLLSEAHDEDTRIPTLRYAFFVGDRLTPRDVRRLRRLAPEVSCISSYGTTETQRAVGCFVVPRDSDGEEISGKAAYPLGCGIEDVQLLVLSREQALAGIGELGEIYVRSPHLARGYLHDDELTQSRFFLNPFTGATGDQLYKTGDLGRYLPDGNIEFVCRVDDQVKIRGFRIELGEIQAVLGEHARVREALVLAREVAWERPSVALGADKQLVAYIVADRETLPMDELREFVKQKLPDYMVPSAFVFLDALPLTANGKVDRKALPAPEHQTSGESLRNPRSPTEIALADIWSEVLNLSQVGIDDNFFDLGGHSLLAIRLMARIKNGLGTEVPLRMLFEGPTIAQLAPKIRSKKQESIFHQREQGNYAHLFELQAGDPCKPIFCFPFRGGLDGEFFNFTRVARHFISQYSFYGVLARGLDGVSEPRYSLQEMAADCVKEIISVQPHGPYIFVGECQGGFVAYEAARQIIADGRKMGLLVLLDTPAGLPAKGFWRRSVVPLKYRVRKSPAWKYFRSRYDYHIQAIRQQKAPAALGYALAKLTRAVSTIPYLIDLEHSENFSRGASDHDRVKLRLDSLRQAFDLAIRRYVLQCYTGRVSLLLNERSFNRNAMHGWADYIATGPEVYKLPGDHDTCVPQNIPLVAQILKDCLAGLEKQA